MYYLAPGYLSALELNGNYLLFHSWQELLGWCQHHFECHYRSLWLFRRSRQIYLQPSKCLTFLCAWHHRKYPSFLNYQEYINIIKSYPFIKKVAMTFPSLWENSLSHTIWAPVGNCTYLLQGECQKAEYTFECLPKSHVTHAQIRC